MVGVDVKHRGAVNLLVKNGTGESAENDERVLARIRKIAESDQIQKILTQLDRSLNRVDRLIAGRENDVAATLNNLRQISDNLRELSENAKRYPSGVIFGEPPKPNSVPGRR